jgi:hypothetical protein
MGLPSNMDDEMLHAFGFKVSPHNPAFAESKLYPQFSVRYRCPTCNFWVSKTINDRCEPCRIGKKPRVARWQFDKLYECCNNRECPAMKQAHGILQEYKVSWEPGHDGFGGYLLMSLPKTWTMDVRCKFHSALANYCVSFQTARKVICSKNPRKRTKLPRTE